MKKLLIFCALLLASACACAQSFSHVQGTIADDVSDTATSLTITLSTNPVQGNLVCVALDLADLSATGLTVNDSNSNSYTLSTSSPNNIHAGDFAQLWLAYLIAPSNATKTITISWTGGTSIATAYAEEFGVSGGTATFDKDAMGSSTSGTTINSPSITPAKTGELLYAIGALDPGSSQTISAPTSGASLGGWTGSAGGIGPSFAAGGVDAEYILSGTTSSTAVDFTRGSPSSNNSGAAMAFSITASGGATQLPTLGVGAIFIAPFLLAILRWIGLH